ncbi:hypothetical protein SASPL_129056 [Salvia splendens]|uniref:Uncharacterized protein n=1 Tax=Salvia splendens TaxID=180675 RepID=A0A8X8ZND0_SALSN|nr:hypothetical protein SASPL_129056 [Salvia splendens]
MTPLFVLCYIIYTTITSTILSLLLALRLLLRRISSLRTSEEIGNVIALYEGSVYHERRHPARNAFRFPARYALIDLDRPPYSPPNYLSADNARRAAKTNGPVHLLRIPSSLGYERSPVNYYYCYEIEGSTKILKKCLVEASNTPWGESVTFVFNPSSDLVPKSEYISPFMDMLGSWRLKVSEPSEHLFAFIAVEHPQLGTYFRASFTAKKFDFSDAKRPCFLFVCNVHLVCIWTISQKFVLLLCLLRFFKKSTCSAPKNRQELIGKVQQFVGLQTTTLVQFCVVSCNSQIKQYKPAPISPRGRRFTSVNRTTRNS